MQSRISWHSSGFVIFKWEMISAADVLRVRLNCVCKSVYKYSLSSFSHGTPSFADEHWILSTE